MGQLQLDGARHRALDCAASGRSCNVDIWAGCGTEPCTYGTTPSACDDANPALLTICAPSGFLEQVDCARENNFVLVHGTEGDIPATIAGEICGDDPMLGDKGCIGTGPACDFFSQECQGDTLVTCAGGSLAERDCAALDPGGQSCGFVTEGPFGGGAACGVVESACDPAGAETCDAGTISFCAQGKAHVVSCVDAGFTGCATATVVATGAIARMMVVSARRLAGARWNPWSRSPDAFAGATVPSSAPRHRCYDRPHRRGQGAAKEHHEGDDLDPGRDAGHRPSGLQRRADDDAVRGHLGRWRRRACERRRRLGPASGAGAAAAPAPPAARVLR